jgi:4-amino-4-deoxy-L-arabinose transferase-like glycosyltransferase
MIDDNLWIDQSPMTSTISHGQENESLAIIAAQPPLYVWAEAVLLRVSPSRSPLATVLPAYVSGTLLILLVYRQARTWSKPGTAIIAAWIVGFHPRTLDAMQRCSPATLGAALILASLQFYSEHILAGQGGRIRGRILFAVGCGACLGLSLMTMGLVGLVIIPIILLHQLALNAGESPLERPRNWYEAWRSLPGFFYGSSAMIVALCVAAPWHVWMSMVHGSEFWRDLSEPSKSLGTTIRGPIHHLLDASPIFLIPAVYSAWLSIRNWFAGSKSPEIANDQLTRPEWRDQAARDNLEQDRNGMFLWTIWAIVVLALSLYWPLGPTNTLGLLLTCSLALLAAHTIRGLSQRQIPARMLIRMTPLIVLGFCWWASSDVRLALIVGQTQGIRNAFTGHHGRALILTIIFSIATWAFASASTRWIRRNDLRIRLVLALDVFCMLAVQMILGVNELRFRHDITRQLLDLREAIVRRNQIDRIEHIHLVGSISPRDLVTLRPYEHESGSFVPMRTVVTPNPTGIDPAGRLRFILRSALPRVPQTDHTSVDSLFRAPISQSLVILVGNDSRLSIAEQSRLGLEPIHPGVARILTAFASGSRPRTRQPTAAQTSSMNSIGPNSVSIAPNSAIMQENQIDSDP